MKGICTMLTVAAATAVITASTAFGAQDGDFRSKNAEPAYWVQRGTWEVFDRSLDPPEWRGLVNTDDLPDGGSTVTIQSGHTVIVDGEQSVGRLRMQRGVENGAGAVLEISGGSLKINRAINMVKRPKTSAPPRIVFSAETGDAGLLQANQGIAIGGTIEVTGAAGGIVRLTNSDHHLSFGGQGIMSATGGPLVLDGGIEMDGRVVADGPYQITVTGAGPRVGSSGTWRLDHTDAVIRFETDDALYLRSAKFWIGRGTLDVGVNLVTSGEVMISENGVINERPGSDFNATGLVRDID